MFSSRRQKSISRRVQDLFWPRIGLLRAWRYSMHRLARIKVSSHNIALGFAAGAFVSFTPFIGFHFILAAAVAVLMRGNLIASAVGTVVGNPITFPFIWLATYNLGAVIQGQPTKDHLALELADNAIGLFSDGPVALIAMLGESVGPYIVPMLLGGIPLGAVCGILCYYVVLVAVDQCKRKHGSQSLQSTGV